MFIIVIAIFSVAIFTIAVTKHVSVHNQTKKKKGKYLSSLSSLLVLLLNISVSEQNRKLV